MAAVLAAPAHALAPDSADESGRACDCTTEAKLSNEEPAVIRYVVWCGTAGCNAAEKVFCTGGKERPGDFPRDRRRLRRLHEGARSHTGKAEAAPHYPDRFKPFPITPKYTEAEPLSQRFAALYSHCPQP
jgi:hypothetical protein